MMGPFPRLERCNTMGWLAQVKERFSKETVKVPKENQCPRCQKNLRETKPDEISNVVVDICPKCFGMWFERGELDRLDKSVWTNIESYKFHKTEGDHPAAPCPKCLMTLRSVVPDDFPEVTLDRCTSCEGFWLDAGELDRVRDIASHIEQQSDVDVGDEKPPGWSDLRWMIVKTKRERD